MGRLSERDVVGIIEHFEELPEPRSSVNRRHLLIDIIVISVCGVIAGADGPAAIERWAKLQFEWLKKHLKLPHGIPAHDTIGRVLESLKPAAFQQCFAAWMESLGEREPSDECEPAENQAKLIAIDGKTLRRSHDRRKQLGPLHLVSAWASDRGITLGQIATAEKSNEITAIPELLDQLDVAGAIVTIDAAGCQKNIACKIINGKGDYVLALKGNQGTLYAAAQDYLIDHMEDDFARISVSRLETNEKGHGRTEQRTYYQVTVPAELKGRREWAGLKTIGVVIRHCKINGHETTEVRYYISSLRRNIKQFARAVRQHWSIENTLHWSLDMTFREDESRVRGRNVADNLAWLRRIALTLLKQHTGKESLVMKRRMAGWSIDFLMQVLTGKAG